MPELPEVESVARSLRPLLVGQKITTVYLTRLRLRKFIARKAIELALKEAPTVDAIERWGKYLLFHLSNDNSLVVHLGMSGKLYVTPEQEPALPHLHARFSLANGNELRFVDPRRFGVLMIDKTDQFRRAKEFSRLGEDALSNALTVDKLYALLHPSKVDIKTVLLDQRKIAGVGNIYACEALFFAKMNPKRRANKVRRKEIDGLLANVRKVLLQGIDRGGTSFSDYVDGRGLPGSNQDYLAVYAREGEPCLVCKTPIKRIIQSARSTFFCSKCQAAV